MFSRSIVSCCHCVVEGFPTSRLEMEAVADRFDTDGDGYIDYREFVAALRWPARVTLLSYSLSTDTTSDYDDNTVIF